MLTAAPSSGQVRSKDGARIAYDRTGAGPALILIDTVGRYRGCSSFPALIDLLADEFTVYQYDRRGRGASTTRRRYEVAREVEDLAAVIDAAGGSAYVYGLRTGGALGAYAAASKLPIRKLAMLDPSFMFSWDRNILAAFTWNIERTPRRRRGRALESLLVSDNVSFETVSALQGTPEWRAMTSVWRTFAYDCRVREATTRAFLAAVRTPTLVLDPTDSAWDPTALNAADAMQDGHHRHVEYDPQGVPDAVVAALLKEFFVA